MKIDRLIGIITLLLQNEKLTAPKLAERFEVSRRTINRDIEELCRAGIPIVTTQGASGGIAIMDIYKIDKTLFTDTELRAIFAGLSSLNSVSQDNKYQNIIEKFSGTKNDAFNSNHIFIDLSSHYKNSLSPKIELLQTSIENRNIITFVYFNKTGKRKVELEPYLIVFQWSSWYILGVDCNEDTFKLYKLNRISEIKKGNNTFKLREIPNKTLNFSSYFSDGIQAVILFDKSEAYRLIEEYGFDSFTETDKGLLRFSFPFTNQDYLINWVLSFGDKAEIIEPKELRLIVREKLENTINKYY